MASDYCSDLFGSLLYQLDYVIFSKSRSEATKPRRVLTQNHNDLEDRPWATAHCQLELDKPSAGSEILEKPWHLRSN